MSLRITIAPAEPKSRRHILYINEEKWREFHSAVIPLRKLKFLNNFTSIKEFRQHWEEMEFHAARSFALKKLSRSAILSSQLLDFLLKYQVSEETAAKILKDFEGKGLLDDADWIGSFIRRELRKLSSPKIIAEKLKMKGLAREKIAQSLHEHYPENRKREILAKLVEKEIKKTPSKRTVQEGKRLLIGRLARKGFSLTDIYELVR